MDAADADGDTALHECLRSDALAQLKRLQESGDLGGFLAGTSSSIQLLESGSAPSRNAAAAIAATLVAHGADVHVRNLKQQTPLDLCADRTLRVNLLRAFEQRRRATPPDASEIAAPPHSGGSSSAHATRVASLTQRPQPQAHQRASTSSGSISVSSVLVTAGLDRDIPRRTSQTSGFPVLSAVPAAAVAGASHVSSSTEVAPASQPPSSSADGARRTSAAVECLVCSDAPRDTLFDPCGHVCACFACAARVKKCLLCRATVGSRVRIEECLVCSDRPAGVLFRPCRHLVACESCARLMKKCVLCRAPIEQTLPFAALCGSSSRAARDSVSAPEPETSPRHHSVTSVIPTGLLVQIDAPSAEQSSQINNGIADSAAERPETPSLREEQRDSTSAAAAAGGAAAAPSASGSTRDVERLRHQLSELRETYACPVCMDRVKNLVFLCGHGVCQLCGDRLEECPICRTRVERRILLY